jgi:hypothetical protein
MSRLAAGVLAVGLLVGAATLGATEEAPALLFVVTGQSNAGQQGEAGQLTAAQRGPVEGAVYYAPQHTRSQGLVALQPYGGAFGVELSFARAVRQATGRDVVIAKVFSGGTSIIAWDAAAPNAAWRQEMARVGNTGKPAMFPRVLDIQRKAAAAYTAATGRPVELAGVLYIQVERDSKVQYGAVRYEGNLTELIGAWRDEWNAPGLPVVFIDSHSSLSGGGPIVHEAVVNVAGDVAGTAWVAVRDLPKKDSVHFNTAGVWTLGERMAAAWLGMWGGE